MLDSFAPSSLTLIMRTLSFCILAAAGLAPALTAQYAERASLPGSGKKDVDCSGRSLGAPLMRRQRA